MTNLHIPLQFNPGFKFNPCNKHLQIIKAALTPAPLAIKKIDVCCGIAFGKSTLGITLAEALLEMSPHSRIMFLQPDYKRLNSVFWAEWKSIVPPYLYTYRARQDYIEWHNGAILYPRIRWVTGNSDTAADMQRGPNLSAIIDDEAAIGFSLEYYQNGLGRLRARAPVRLYITLSTPKVGPYDALLDQPGMISFNGRTADNAINLPPNFESDMRASMTEMHARRELDGERVALEGQIWSMFDFSHKYPFGNIDDESYVNDEPYILAGDIGVQSSWLIIQRKLKRDVIVGQYHPDDGNVRDDLRFLLRKYGQPSKIITGTDINSRNSVTGEAGILEIKRALIANNCHIVQLITPEGIYKDKSIQYDALSTIMEKRELTLADKCIVDGNASRGFLPLIKQDRWPTKGKQGLFIKDKSSGVGLEDCRDASLYYAIIQHPIRVGAGRAA